MDNIENISYNIEMIANVQCSFCDVKAQVPGIDDNREAATEFYNKGWRFGLDEDDIPSLYCPECAKFLKVK